MPDNSHPPIPPGCKHFIEEYGRVRFVIEEDMDCAHVHAVPIEHDDPYRTHYEIEDLKAWRPIIAAVAEVACLRRAEAIRRMAVRARRHDRHAWYWLVRKPQRWDYAARAWRAWGDAADAGK